MPWNHNTVFMMRLPGNPFIYQRCRKHFECGGCISTFFQTFWQFQKVGGVLCNKIWCSHKVRVVTKSVLSQNTVYYYSIVPTQADKNAC